MTTDIWLVARLAARIAASPAGHDHVDWKLKQFMRIGREAI
jgi:hypothetical protein